MYFYFINRVREIYVNIIKFDIFEEIKGMGEGYIQFLIECIFYFYFYIYFKNVKLLIKNVKLYCYLFIVSSDSFVYIEFKKRLIFLDYFISFVQILF